MSSDPPMCAIFGTGRSGTTWLGSIVDAHPRVLYRFEPLHSLRKDPRIAALRDRLADDSTDAVRDLAAILREPGARAERPPFFPKAGSRTRGRTVLNRAGRKLPFVSMLYAGLYGSPPDARLVFKEVSMERELGAFARSGLVPIVYLIRHPASFVASMKSGIARGVMTDSRAQLALDLAQERAPSLFLAYRDRADALTIEQRLAIAWVADTNLALSATTDSPTAMNLVYENLCLNTSDHARAVYKHFGLDMPDQAKAFIDSFTSGTESKEVGVNPYFSVFRDPLASMNKWKNQLDKAAVRQIREIYEHGEAAQYFSKHWDWDCQAE